MNRIFGYLVGIVWLGLAFGAFRVAQSGVSEGYTDIVFWWSVIGVFLAIAGLGALIGTTIHAGQTRESAH